MNKNVLIVLGGAVLAAFLVALLVQVSLGGKKEVVADESSVQVLVAAKDLKIGRELAEGDLRWKNWSEDNLFSGAIVRDDDIAADDALSGRLDRNFAQGEAVTEKGILKETNSNVVAARLRMGERAISIKVSEEDLVAGFIAPGNFVDVILTYDERISFGDSKGSKGSSEVKDMIDLNIKKWATETILDNVRVLALNQTTDVDNDADKKTKKLGKNATVTLAVPIRDAEKLSLASEMGNITLAMRGVGDDAANPDSPAITDARLTKIDNEIHEAYLELKKESGVDMNSVKVYNGANVETLSVK